MTDYEKQQARKAELRELYIEWWSNRTPDESKLLDNVFEYEDEFFDDFTFKPGSIITPYIEYEIEYDGEWVTEYVEVPDDMTSIDFSHYRLYVAELDDGTEGQINNVDRIITIPKENIDNKSVVLHEMIHAYINSMSDYYWTFREILTTCLYKDMSAKIPDLEDRLIANSQLLISQQTMLQGGEHGTLFFLKSLDLDLRCGYKLGTVCGYGRDEYTA